MLNIGNLEYLGVNVIKQGTYVGPNFSMYSSILYIIAFALVGLMFYVLFNRKKKLVNPMNSEEYVKKVRLKVDIIMYFLGLFCMLSVVAAMGIVPICKINYDYSQSKSLSEIKETEYIVELTENTDLEKLTEIYSVYMIEDSVIVRTGSCENRFIFKSRSDNTIPYEILNKVSPMK